MLGGDLALVDLERVFSRVVLCTYNSSSGSSHLGGFISFTAGLFGALASLFLGFAAFMAEIFSTC